MRSAFSSFTGHTWRYRFYAMPKTRYTCFTMAKLACRRCDRSKSFSVLVPGPWMRLPTFPHVGMDQYLLIPFLGGWTSIYQLFWCSPGYTVLTHCHVFFCLPLCDGRWSDLSRFAGCLRGKWRRSQGPAVVVGGGLSRTRCESAVGDTMMWLAQGFIVTMIWGWYFSKEYMIILEFFLIFL